MTTQQPSSSVWQSDFVFLDTGLNKSTSNELVKVHAMRKWHGKRRHPQASGLFPRGGELQPWTQQETQSRSTLGRLIAREEISSLPVAAKHKTHQPLSRPTAPRRRESAGRTFPVPIIAPYDALGAGRGDPFAQYPYRQSRSVDMLLDHYISSRAGMLCPELISLYRADSASFCSFLAVIATHFSVVTSQRPGISSDEAEGHALRLLNNRLENRPLLLHSGTILGIALIANLEECRGNRVTADLHWNGLNKAIEAKGGLEQVMQYKELYATIFWLEAIRSNSRDCCLGQLDSGFHLDQGSYNQSNVYLAALDNGTFNDITISTKEHFKPEYEQFFKGIVHHISRAQPLVATEFVISDCIINSIQKKCEEEPQRSRQAKMASLIYLAAVKIDNIQTLEVFSNFTLQIHRKTYSRVGNYTLCGEELLHMLFNGVGLYGSQSCRYSCLTSRLICVARTLPPDAWNTAFGILSYFLGIPYHVASLSEVLDSSQHPLNSGIDTSFAIDNTT